MTRITSNSYEPSLCVLALVVLLRCDASLCGAPEPDSVRHAVRQRRCRGHRRPGGGEPPDQGRVEADADAADDHRRQVDVHHEAGHLPARLLRSVRRPGDQVS